jgi:hypothetical protein
VYRPLIVGDEENIYAAISNAAPFSNFRVKEFIKPFMAVPTNQKKKPFTGVRGH